ncbi:MAG: hypothetical protein EKK53_00170 [Burkholderiales bacterium]|nr:MAG: hypothetical protein EKK53_00170 [Burkholderiales bacterium]
MPALPLRPPSRPASRRPVVARAFAQAACITALALAGGASSGADINDPTRGDVVLFPVPFETLRPATAGKPALEGWNMPGRNFRAGDGWWGLVCGTATNCRLVALRLAITPAKHDVYETDPVPSQWLVWSPLPAVGELHAVFKPVRSLAGLPLAAGPVKTWLQRGMAGPYPDAGRIATMEVAITVAPGTTALLVPRLRPAIKRDAGSGQPEALVLELRAGQQRQLLEDFENDSPEALSPVDPKAYLVWAGDLDGDGKLDLLLDTGSCSRKLTLWLSSRAKGPEMVGLAGSFEYFDPARSEC